MRLGLVTKRDKKNKTTSKKSDDDSMMGNCNIIVIFLIYDQFGGIWGLASECIVCKTYIIINSNLLLYQN